ncbi:MAG: type I restriction enzyme HsdR N-terminal domain-containing protein [Desulfobacteraceae bacterium]|jgi:hypothetical protein|nr:type I restriction enzyme HsdR N-terminal domain-containing protein [Desulfobacteraceae bacterium]
MAPDISESMINDYITGQCVPEVGAEANRQAVERILVDEKGYAPEEISVDAPISVAIDGETYRSRVDLVVCIGPRPLMAVKCAAGNLDSRQREIVAVARLLAPDRILPLAVASDGKSALVWDAVTGKELGSGLEAIPDRKALADRFAGQTPDPLAPERLAREKIVFRSYDSMNVNTPR